MVPMQFIENDSKLCFIVCLNYLVDLVYITTGSIDGNGGAHGGGRRARLHHEASRRAHGGGLKLNEQGVHGHEVPVESKRVKALGTVHLVRILENYYGKSRSQNRVLEGVI